MTTLQQQSEPHEDTGTSEVADAVDRARAATVSWRRTAPAERAACLRAAADAVRAHVEDLADDLTGTTGRLLRESRESATVAAALLDEAAVTGLAGGRSLAGASGAVDWVRHEPRGVVAVLTPWNDPYPAAAGLLAAALVTGNTVVHKPSERSAGPGLHLARLVRECLPAGVLEVVEGGPDVGRELVDLVDVVCHIGSSASGREIRTVCAARGAKAITENGGKDPLVVDAGVDPAWAASQVAIGAFTNAGQLCTSVERVYLHRDVADAVTEELVALARASVAGDPRDEATTLARLVDEQQLSVVQAQVEEAVRRGARVLCGGHRLDRDGPWFRATVLDRCEDDMEVMLEETFGPVAPLVTVDSWEEGLARAATSRYGLAATVLTPDARHALQAVEELPVGTVKVNAVFGGAPGGSADPRGDSGAGRGYGPDLLGELVALKAVHWEPGPPA
ncbi:aldehyde dehydrogenase family protein [Knoellia sp. CPCC 206435]|uniref:aldehyde dehydrogenase family protein n=1 Tax=Knoellia terrae TaxID=3404797 RepID=UPI003B42A94A